MRRQVLWILMAVTFVAVALLRFMATVGFTDDHYMHLAGARQMLYGEWPSHDFVDLGMPLMYGVSAAAQATFGASLLTEAVLVAVAFGLAAALTLRAAAAVSGSMLIALGAVALQVAIYPRTYSYPKVLLYVVGILAIWRYTDRPSTPRLAAVSAVVVLAFLMRHDHGLYIGLAGLTAVVIARFPGGPRRVATEAALYAGMVALMLLPYAVYLASGVGLIRHVQAGLSLREIEVVRTRLPWIWFDFEGPLALNAGAWLYYLFYALPVIALAIAWLRPSALRPERVVPLAVLALLANLGLIRDTLWVRLPDAVAPAALLLAALLPATGAWRASWARVAARTTAAVVVAITGWSAVVVGGTREVLDRAGLFGDIGGLPEHFRNRVAELRGPSPRQAPSATAGALLPFFAYADRCLADDHFLLTPGFIPEVAVWAGQPFAGGQIWYQPGVLASDEDQQLVLSRLSRQTVPVAVMQAAEYEELAATFPALRDYVTRHFTFQAVVDSRAGPLSIRMNTALATGTDASTGWPCFEETSAALEHGGDGRADER